MKRPSKRSKTGIEQEVAEATEEEIGEILFRCFAFRSNCRSYRLSVLKGVISKDRGLERDGIDPVLRRTQPDTIGVETVDKNAERFLAHSISSLLGAVVPWW
jgi:hypothetical protein